MLGSLNFFAIFAFFLFMSSNTPAFSQDSFEEDELQRDGEDFQDLSSSGDDGVIEADGQQESESGDDQSIIMDEQSDTIDRSQTDQVNSEGSADETQPSSEQVSSQDAQGTDSAEKSQNHTDDVAIDGNLANVKAEQSDQNSGENKSSEQEKPLIGSYKLGLAILRPEFTELQYFDYFYGRASNYFNVYVDQYLLRKSFFGLGLRYGLGYFVDDGYALESLPAEGQEKQESTIIKDAPINLTIIPFQLGINFEAALWPNKVVVLELGFGYERCFS